MLYTLRFLILLAGAPLLLALSAWVPILGMAAAAYLLLLMTLLLVDHVGLQSAAKLTVTRDVPKDISIGHPTQIRLHFRSRFPKAVHAKIRDTLPAVFTVDKTERSIALVEGEAQTITHTIRALKRGRYTLGPVHLRLTGALGLAERRLAVGETQEVEVIPNIKATESYELRLRRGLIRNAGIRSMRLAGRGDEFESLREYTPDDDPRHIDWRSTARRGKVLTRNFQPESKQRIIIAIDLGRLMLGRSGELAKVDAVLNSALLLAHAALRVGDSVGFVAFSDVVESRIPVGSGPRLTRALLREAAPLEARAVESDYRLLLREAGENQRKRSLVVLFTDFLDATQIEELQTTLLTLNRRHRLLIAAVRDAELYEIAKHPATVPTEAFASAAASHLTMQRRSAIASLSRAGIFVADLGQEHLSLGIVERYLAMREAASF